MDPEATSQVTQIDPATWLQIVRLIVAGATIAIGSIGPAFAEETVLRAAQEAEDAMVAFLNFQEQAAALGLSVEAAKRSVDLALIQYRDGAVDYTRVLNTQQSLVRAQDEHTLSRGDIALNLVALYRSLGGGWQIREGNDFVPANTTETMAERTDWGGLLSPEAVDVPEPRDAADSLRRFDR